MSSYDELKDRLYIIAGLLDLADSEWAEVYEHGPLVLAAAQLLARDGTDQIDEDEYEESAPVPADEPSLHDLVLRSVHRQPGTIEDDGHRTLHATSINMDPKAWGLR